MANWYVDSNAAGGATGADWANAYVTLKAAAEAAGTAAGDSIWVAHNHAETGAIALTVTTKNTSIAFGTILCVNSAGTVPPVAADLRTTATVTTTGASAMTLVGAGYFYGITFNCGTGAVSSALTVLGTPNDGYMIFENCVLAKLGTSATSAAIIIGQSFGLGRTGNVELVNTALQFGSVTDGVILSGGRKHIWRGTTTPIAGANVPSVLFTQNGNTHGFGAVELRGLDLSQFASKTLFGSASANAGQTITLANCKLGSSCVISNNAVRAGGNEVNVIDCDSGNTNYRNERYSFGGTLTTETTIVRTGGGSDGTTPISWKIVATANANTKLPFECFPITVWSDSTGAKTVSIYGYWNNAAVPTSAQIWMVAEYLGTSGFPQSLLVSSGPATVLTAGSNIPADTSVWGGGVTTSKFKMSVSLTTTLKGPLTVRVYVAAASQTFYVDPKIEIV